MAFEEPGRKYLGTAQIVVPRGGGEFELHAACPMFNDNLEQLQQGLLDNHAALNEQSIPTIKEK
jgi:hypothetical protein